VTQALHIFRGMRPRQWTKNVFVLAPLLFAMRLTDLRSLAEALTAFVVFCMVAGAVYLVNDIVDREADRNHPEKRNRPIASGALAVETAWVAACALVVAAVGGAALWRPAVALVVALFFLANLAYSFRLKRIPVADVLIISFGFILRVVGGGLAIDVPISLWILLCTFMLSLYLGVGKRLHERVLLGDEGVKARPALRGYRLDTTRRLFRLAGLGAAGAFAAYTLSERAVVNFGTRGLIYTLPLVLVGLWRFDRLAENGNRPTPPTEALLTDPVVVVSAVLWGIAATCIIYFPGVLPS
jgi:decaprenyl-phosphate phosphoribosyltransferase